MSIYRRAEDRLPQPPARPGAFPVQPGGLVPPGGERAGQRRATDRPVRCVRVPVRHHRRAQLGLRHRQPVPAGRRRPQQWPVQGCRRRRQPDRPGRARSSCGTAGSSAPPCRPHCWASTTSAAPKSCCNSWPSWTCSSMSRCRATNWSSMAPLLEPSGVRVLIDHCGRPDPDAGLDQPGFARLLELGRHRPVLREDLRPGEVLGAAVPLARTPGRTCRRCSRRSPRTGACGDRTGRSCKAPERIDYGTILTLSSG